MPGAARTPMCQAPPWATSASASQPKPGRPVSMAVRLSTSSRVGDGQPEDRRPADVLPGEVDRAEAEVRDQLVQVLGRGLAVVVARRGVRVAEAAQVHGEDPVAARRAGG